MRPAARTLSGRRLVRSVAVAARGVGTLVATEPNAWIHLAATALVVVAGVALHLSAAEWRWIVAAVAGVWVAEAFNTAIESVTDLASPALHPLAGRAKDVAAGAVLLAALAAVVIGVLVLGPHAWLVLTY